MFEYSALKYLFLNVLDREGPKTRIIRRWDHDTAVTMRGCFEGTNWDIFYENEDDLDTITDSITSYICFCEENIVQTKRIKVYANSKPWVNRELKTILLEKRKAFLEGDKQKQHELEKEFKWKNKVGGNIRIKWKRNWQRDKVGRHGMV